MSLADRWAELTGAMGRVAPDPPVEDDDAPVNRAGVEENADIRAILADDDYRNALFGLIDQFAAESLAETMANRADHAHMLGSLGAYARLQELKGELGRLAGLTES